MSKALKYDTIYGAGRDALGAPNPHLVKAVEACGPAPLRVLDLGCGQGRDAVFIARLGHRVVAVDISSVGLDQLRHDAAAESLDIETVQADLTTYQPQGCFDVILADRTFHMLGAPDRATLLARLLPCTNPGARVMIVDEPRNLPALRAALKADARGWQPVLDQKGYLFMQRKVNR